jgi:hypothetical protein
MGILFSKRYLAKNNSPDFQNPALPAAKLKRPVIFAPLFVSRIDEINAEEFPVGDFVYSCQSYQHLKTSKLWLQPH